MAKCGNCGNKKAYRWQVAYTKQGRQESCNACGDIGSALLPDVYFPGRHTDANIVDKMGNEITIESRGHKQALLRERGWIEAGLGRDHRMRV